MSRSAPKAESADDAALFLAAVEAATPLGDRDRVATPPDRDRRGPRRPLAAARTWQIERDEVCGSMRGRASGVSDAQLVQLERGRLRPGLTLDLHGHTLAQARTALARAFKQAAQRGVTCVLVIHGKGRHSDGSAVLREHLPELAADPTVAPGACAFATATVADGGTGATYVLVRRP